MALKDKEKYLDNLSKEIGIFYFNKIFLIGAIEDGFVPYQSAILI